MRSCSSSSVWDPVDLWWRYSSVWDPAHLWWHYSVMLLSPAKCDSSITSNATKKAVRFPSRDTIRRQLSFRVHRDAALSSTYVSLSTVKFVSRGRPCVISPADVFSGCFILFGSNDHRVSLHQYISSDVKWSGYSLPLTNFTLSVRGLSLYVGIWRLWT